MKAKLVIVFLILSPISILAQFKFLPVIDSLLICSYSESRMLYTLPDAHGYSYPKLALFYIVEEMPKPKIPISEIEFLLKKNIRFNAKEMNCNGNIYLQCIVNCKGQAGDYQLIHCPDKFVNIGCQALNVFRKWIVTWEPPIQKGKSVDLLAMIKVAVTDGGKFEIVAPFY